MATQSYTKTATMNRSGGWTGKACLVTDNSLPVFGTVSVPIGDFSTREGSAGDGHMPTPYVASFREDNPWVGVVYSDNHAVFPPGNMHKQCEPDAGRWVSNGGIGWTLGFVGAELPLWDGQKDFLRGMAQTSAKAALTKSLVNVPLLVKERKETAALLASYGRRIMSPVGKAQADAVRRYVAAAPKNKRRVARDIANEHLALLFGLLPLIDEAKGVAELASRDDTLVITGRGRRALDDYLLESGKHLPSGLISATSYRYAHALEWSAAIDSRRSCRTSLVAEISIPSLAALRAVGFNPLATGYDLVPLSFLTDFVSNLGTFIRSMDPKLGLEFKWGCSTFYRERKVSYAAHGLSGLATPSSGSVKLAYSSVGSGSASSRVVDVERIVFTTMPDSELYFANNMSIAKAVTVAAIAVQRYVKPVKRVLSAKRFRYRGPRPLNLPPVKYRVY